MPEQIVGPPNNTPARVSVNGRLLTNSTIQLASSQASSKGNLFGLGTGPIELNSADNDHEYLWFRNDAVSEDIKVQKLIFGWNGGSTTFIRPLYSLIYYNVGAPSANNTEIDDQIENISRTGSAAVKSGKILAYKYDGSANNGMTSGSGGFAQIPNTLAIGNTSIPIDGEIVLGPGNSMSFRIQSPEVGRAHIAVVYYFVPTGSDITDVG